MATVFGYDFKKYNSISVYDFDRLFIKLAKEKISKSGDILKGSLDMNQNKLINLPIPFDSGDGANMIYVKQFSQINTVEIPELIDIGKLLLELIQQDKTMVIYKDNFFVTLKICENLLDDYMAIFEKKEPAKIFEELQNHCLFFQDLKIHIIHLILNLPEKIFLDFKSSIEINNLLVKSDDLKKVLNL